MMVKYDRPELRRPAIFFLTNVQCAKHADCFCPLWPGVVSQISAHKRIDCLCTETTLNEAKQIVSSTFFFFLLHSFLWAWFKEQVTLKLARGKLFPYSHDDGYTKKDTIFYNANHVYIVESQQTWLVTKVMLFHMASHTEPRKGKVAL
jgi:hypothetical protein